MIKSDDVKFVHIFVIFVGCKAKTIKILIIFARGLPFSFAHSAFKAHNNMTMLIHCDLF